MMTKEELNQNEEEIFQKEGESSHSELQTENNQSELILRYQKQQITNMKIKRNMARELEGMDLPKYVADRILNIDDEPPF
jgi:hypothetical protein